MSRISHVRMMAEYNEWMNANVYKAAGALSDDALSADRKAFFGSILGTLNHLAVADTIWLKRFAAHPSASPSLAPVSALPEPVSLDQLFFVDIRSLFTYRRQLDRLVVAWVKSIEESDLDEVLHYKNVKGVAASRSTFSLLMHLFNHQTHHRGQATTLLFQAGVDVGVTDLSTLMPNLSVS